MRTVRRRRSVTQSPPEQGGAPATKRAPLPLLPTRELIVFPKMVAPLFVGRERSIQAIEAAFGEKTPLILSSQRDGSVEDPGADDIMPVGTRVAVLQLFKLPDGRIKILLDPAVHIILHDRPRFQVSWIQSP